MYARGTGGMTNHVCKVKEPAVRLTLTKESLSEFENKLMTLIVNEVLPTSLTASENLLDLVHCAIEIGSNFGNVDAKCLLPSPKTLSRHIKSKADTVRQTLVADIKDAMGDGLLSATVDGWTDNQRGRKYLAHTVEYINEDFQLQENSLFIPHCDAESVTASVIKEEINSNLATLGLDPEAKVHYTTDDGADIVCALKESDRSYCMDHCTNLCVKKVLQLQLTKIDLYGENGAKVLNSVESAVYLIKSSRLKKNSVLKTKLIKGPNNRLQQTHFLSCVLMLLSVKKNFEQVKKSVQAMGHTILNGISSTDVQDVIDIVSSVENLARKSGNELNASHYESIVNITSIDDLDSPLRAELKAHIKKELVILEILVVIKKCKQVVKFIKTSGINDKLEGGSLKQEVETRWMSLLHLLKSFFPNESSDITAEDKMKQINNVLSNRKKYELLISADDIEVMKSLIEVLTPFEEAIKKFEFEKEPTIQHVLPQFHKLQSTVRYKVDDSATIAKFRSQLRKELEKFRINIDERHLIGAFLWPKLSSLIFLTESERLQVLTSVRALCAEQEIILHGRSTPIPEPPAKRMRQESDSEDEYAELCERGQVSKPTFDEVDHYLLLSRASSNVKSRDILKWWKEMSSKLPVLSRVARMILATPASSASSERKFNIAGQLISSRRNCLKPENVEDILILHDFIRKGRPLP